MLWGFGVRFLAGFGPELSCGCSAPGAGHGAVFKVFAIKRLLPPPAREDMHGPLRRDDRQIREECKETTSDEAVA